MDYSSLANATAASHIVIVLAVFIGILISLRYKRYRPWESAAMIIIVVLWSIYGNCPLTILEQYFRDLAGQATNLTTIGFLPYYAQKFLGISFTSQMVQRTTFFTGGIFFAASIEWISPYINMELFKLRKTLRKMFGLRPSRRTARA